jgi:hypothetical protein
MGIEPTSEAWEASILPLYDARSKGHCTCELGGGKAARALPGSSGRSITGAGRAAQTRPAVRRQLGARRSVRQAIVVRECVSDCAAVVRGIVDRRGVVL